MTQSWQLIPLVLSSLACDSFPTQDKIDLLEKKENINVLAAHCSGWCAGDRGWRRDQSHPIGIDAMNWAFHLHDAMADDPAAPSALPIVTPTPSADSDEVAALPFARSTALHNNALERTRRVGVPAARAVVRVSPRRSAPCSADA